METEEQDSLFGLEERIKPKTRKMVPLDQLPEVLALPELKDSIVKFGIQVPILLMERSGGKYEIVDGKRRVASCRLINEESVANEQTLPFKTIAALIYEDAGAVGAVLTLIANNVRGPNPASEFEAIMRLVKDHKLSLKEVARELHISFATVQARARMSDLEPELKAAFLTGDLSFSAAKAAVKLPKKAQKRVVTRLRKKAEEGKKVTAAEVGRERQIEVVKEQEKIDSSVFDTPGFKSPELPKWPVMPASDTKDCCVDRDGVLGWIDDCIASAGLLIDAKDAEFDVVVEQFRLVKREDG